MENYGDSEMKARNGNKARRRDYTTWPSSETKEEGASDIEEQSFGIYIVIKHTFSYMISAPRNSNAQQINLQQTPLKQRATH